MPARFTLAELVIETQVAPDEVSQPAILFYPHAGETSSMDGTGLLTNSPHQDPAPLLLQVLACLCSRRGEDGADGAARDALARFIGRAMAPTAGSGRGSGMLEAFFSCLAFFLFFFFPFSFLAATTFWLAEGGCSRCFGRR